MTHQRYWDAARRQYGDKDGTAALIEVLLAHRTMPTAALLAAMQAAMSTGTLDPQLVLIEARRGAHSPLAPVVAIGALARYDRPVPSLAGYDTLLTAHAAGSTS